MGIFVFIRLLCKLYKTNPKKLDFFLYFMKTCHKYELPLRMILVKYDTFYKNFYKKSIHVKMFTIDN